MKIAIIGGTSRIGSALKSVLSEFSEVITAGRRGCDVHIDLSDPIEKMILPQGVDTIVHTAAHFGGTFAQELIEAETTNVLGTLKICITAREAKVKHIVLISSIFACLNRSSPFYSIYALSKRHSEEIAEYYCEANSIALTILRPSQIYGDDTGHQKHQPFMYSIIDSAERGDEVVLYGSHDAQRNYLHISDLTSIIARVVQLKVEGVYACMFPTDLTYSRIVKAAITAFGSKKGYRFVRSKPNILDNVFENDDSLYKKIGFLPQVTIEEGMRRIAIYRQKVT